jgi:hypothetical protein
MGITQAEAIAERLKQEAKRLYGGALVRVSIDAYPGDDGADLYVYAPRKYSDMLLAKLKTLKIQLLKNTKVSADKLRIFMEDSENMSPQLKEKLMAEQGSPQNK